MTGASNTEFGAAMLRLALALGVGLLIGVERGWQARDDAEGAASRVSEPSR